MLKTCKDTIEFCDCQVLAHYRFEGGQYILTLASEAIARATKPGQFVHIKVSNMLLMRRPISVMSVDINNGTFDLLYKVVGEGTRQLSERKIGDVLSVIGPIGNGFELTDTKRPLLIGGGVGIPPMIAIAQAVKNKGCHPFAILGSELPFPFAEKMANNAKSYAGATHTMPLLEDWGVECRLASLGNFEGVFKGFVTDLARVFLETLSAQELAQVKVYSCGPKPMLEAVAELAKEYNLACQVSLEEYMACGIGGCAGCVVEVRTNNEVSMRRVCVDGPVFDSRLVF